MGLDIRIPIGLLFSAIGLVLTIAGLVLGVDPGGHTLGINIDLWWGLVMLIFGLGMLALSLRKRTQ